MNQKVKANELLKIIVKLNVNDKIHVVEPNDGLTFAIEKIKWSDSIILLFGGHGTLVQSCDISPELHDESEIEENILDTVNKLFHDWGITEVNIDD